MQCLPNPLGVCNDNDMVTTRLFLFFFAVTAIELLAQACSIVRNPIFAVSAVENPTIHTSSSAVLARSHFALTFTFNELHVKFVLEPNHHVLGENTRVTHLAPNGSVSHSGEVDRLQYKVFKGNAWIARAEMRHGWQEAGWARVLVVQDGPHPLFEGVFTVDGDRHHVQLSRTYLRARHRLDPPVRSAEQEYMVVWRDSDVLPAGREGTQQDLRRGLNDSDGAGCDTDQLSFNSNLNHPVYAGMMKRSEASLRAGDSHITVSMGKRLAHRQRSGSKNISQTLISTIGQTFGCPSERMVAMVGIATDCTYTSDFDSTESVTQNIIQMMNTASAVWEDAFNITLSLANLTISDASCPGTPSEDMAWNQDCSSGINIRQRLSLFSAWRIKQRDENSHWTLLSACSTGSIVGVAWLGQACVKVNMDSNATAAEDAELDSGGGEQTVSGANVVVRAAGTDEWQVFAHETGHTFGAVHDCTGKTCSSSSDTASAQQCCPLSANACDAHGMYIMNPSSRPGIKNFSPCSVGNICSAIGHKSVDTSCLKRSAAAAESSSWIDDYKPVAIGVPSALGLAIMIALLGYCFCRFRRRCGKKETLPFSKAAAGGDGPASEPQQPELARRDAGG